MIMPCKEMKELEASFHHHQEASRSFPPIDVSDLSGGMPYGEARVAYTMQMHRQSCPLCRKS
jgi:hypothetical protein